MLHFTSLDAREETPQPAPHRNQTPTEPNTKVVSGRYPLGEEVSKVILE